MTIEKLETRIEELEAANILDQEELSKTKELYEKAVNDFDSEKSDSMYEKIAAYKLAIENRIKQIGILRSPDNPIRLQSQSVRLKKLEDAEKAAKKKADALNEKILAAQAEYIEIANEIAVANNEYRIANIALNRAKGANIPPGPYLVPHRYTVSVGTDRYGKNILFKGGVN